MLAVRVIYCVAVATVVAGYCVANELAVSVSLGGALRRCLYNRQSPLSVTVRALYACVDCILPHVRWDREELVEKTAVLPRI